MPPFVAAGGFRVADGYKGSPGVALARGRWIVRCDEGQHRAHGRHVAGAKADGFKKNPRRHTRGAGKVYERQCRGAADAGADRFGCKTLTRLSIAALSDEGLPNHEAHSAATPQPNAGRSPAKTPRRKGRIRGNDFV